MSRKELPDRGRRVNEPRYKDGVLTRVCRPCKRVDPKMFCQVCGEATIPTKIFNNYVPGGPLA